MSGNHHGEKGKKSTASLFFDAQTRCLAYIEWVFKIFGAVKKDYGANYMLYSAELLGILSVLIIAHGKHTLLEPHDEEEQFVQ